MFYVSLFVTCAIFEPFKHQLVCLYTHTYIFSVGVTGCVSIYLCFHANPSPCLLLPQPYVPTEEEQMAPLPPNPFSELSEKELEEYRKNVERRQLGLSGMRNTHSDKHTHTQGQQKLNLRVNLQLNIGRFKTN